MSERWRGYQNKVEVCDANRMTLDTAARYGLRLQELHTKCLNDASFCVDILGYSDTTSEHNVGGLPPNQLTQADFETFSPRLPRNNTGECAATGSHDHREDFRLYPHVVTSSPNISSNSNHGHRHYIASPPNSILNQLEPPYGSQGLGMDSRVTASNDMMGNGITGDRIPSMENTGLMNMNHGSETIEDELSAMSHSLLGQQFLELDRVITLEGTDFDFDMSNWGSVS
jgi:hypothetical protein